MVAVELSGTGFGHYSNGRITYRQEFFPFCISFYFFVSNTYYLPGRLKKDLIHYLRISKRVLLQSALARTYSDSYFTAVVVSHIITGLVLGCAEASGALAIIF